MAASIVPHMSKTDDSQDSPNQQRFMIGDRSPSLAVIESVASMKGKSPGDLPILAKHTNPEALDEFITRTTEGVVQFKYDGVVVEVFSSGELRVTEATG